MIEEMAKALAEGRHYSGAETAWANFRRKEVESSLGIGKKETVFTEKILKPAKKSSPTPATKTTVTENTVVTVTVMEGKKRKLSRLSIRYGELDEQLKGKVAQFALF